MEYPDNSRLEVEWEEDKAVGLGKLFYANGDLYEGLFKDHKKEGKGIIRFADGSVYEGDFS